jgi:uncharacterized protein
MHFEIFRDGSGQWRWRLRTRNGNVIADSAESYVHRSDCEHGIALVKQSAEAEITDMSAQVAGR